MSNSSISIPVATLGTPRIGPHRELKTALENFWAGKIDEAALVTTAAQLRAGNWARQKARGVTRKLVGFRLDGQGIPRHGYPVHLEGREVDVVRSGTMSPSLGEPIGTTYLPADAAKVGTRFEVEIRGERVPAEVVKRPFWTEGSARKGR